MGKFANLVRQAIRELHIRKLLVPPPAPRQAEAPGERRQIPQLPVPVVTIGLLPASNILMTFAWNGHLKYKTTGLITVILTGFGFIAVGAWFIFNT